MPPKPVTVSVVSHGQAQLVAQLLSDLDLHCRDVVDKVILTCNLSEPLQFDPSGFGFPVEVLQNAAPMGFGANHNQAFTHCQTEWFLVINPDVRLASNVVSALWGRATHKTGLLAPLEVLPSGDPADGPRGPITPPELLWRQFFKRPSPSPKDGGWVKGMFMLLRAQAYRSLTGFDERYFMYCEDFDLCARLMLDGWTVDYHADIPVTHAWQRGSRRTWTHLKHHLISLIAMWTSSAFWKYRKLHRHR